MWWNEKEGERGLSEKRNTAYEDSSCCEKSVSSIKHLGCNKI